MICHLEGRLAEKTPISAVIDVGGVGYSVHISVSTYESLGVTGSKTRLLTHLAVKDDKMELFGFATSEEKKLFLMLISVSGIGGRTAMSILSGAKPGELKKAILTGDKKSISSIRGIGQKTAERLIVELKDKFKDETYERRPTVPVCDDAVGALKSLGFTPRQAEEAVARVMAERGKDIPVEEMVREALKRFS